MSEQIKETAAGELEQGDFKIKKKPKKLVTNKEVTKLDMAKKEEPKEETKTEPETVEETKLEEVKVEQPVVEKTKTEESPVIEEIKVDQLPDSFDAKTIEDLQIRKMTGCTVVGMRSLTTPIVINPPVDAKLKSDSVIFVLGNAQQIEKLKQLFSVSTD